MSTDRPADPGYAFAAFRSHAAQEFKRGPWCAPGFTSDTHDSLFTNNGTCQCGEGYSVADQYHWHSWDGRCHNRGKCV